MTAVDWRRPEVRPDVFLDFWQFHTVWRSHPGCVYYLMPYLRDHYGWTEEEALWFAFINGNTQNPVTSLMLHRRGSTPSAAEEMLTWYEANVHRLPWDTDRRYHRRALPQAVSGYLRGTKGNQAEYWNRVAAGGWGTMWRACSAIPTFGRLSAFSFAEYLRIMGVPFDCDDLMLEDQTGSRSHRNGMAIVMGRDDLDWHQSNPEFDGHYTEDVLQEMRDYAHGLREIMSQRAVGQPWAKDVSYFTLESALCTYKSWHRPNRRYPNVYNDMLHDRIRMVQGRFPEEDLDVFWAARSDCLPNRLRLEDNPGDPGCVPVKQNWYRTTGEVIMMEGDFAQYVNGFRAKVDWGELGRREEVAA